MRALMWLNAAIGVGLVALSAALHGYGQTPIGAEFPPKVEQNIAAMDDLARLKDLGVRIVRAGNETVRAMNDFIRTGLDAFAIFALGFALICIVNALCVFKHLRAAAGRPVRWLAWF
jgi:hypothetical protein